jgi:hypothetical protein
MRVRNEWPTILSRHFDAVYRRKQPGFEEFSHEQDTERMEERKLQEQGLNNPKRRRFSAGMCLSLVTAMAGCGGSTDELLATGAGPAWDVVPSRSLSLAPGASFDLAATLPAGVAPGGVFEVDSSGAPLPAGVTLTPGGQLFVSGSATGRTAGVVFRYTPRG